MSDGFLLVDKSAGWTSHDVVAKLRGITGIRRIGHAGTLDPLATGLLVLGVGRATKQLSEIAAGDKTYLATVRLGAISTTDDAEGEIVSVSFQRKPESKDVKQALQSFTGRHMQLPPAYSAIKTGGRKHYELARAGKDVPREPRPVTVYEIEPISYTWPEVSFRCRVSKGTYIRSLARDLGEKLSTGGYLTALRRETVGRFRLEDAHTIKQLSEGWQKHLIVLK